MRKAPKKKRGFLNALVTNYRTEQIKTFCNTIDNALQFYAKNHRAVYPPSGTKIIRLKFRVGNKILFPTTVLKLLTLQKKLTEIFLNTRFPSFCQMVKFMFRHIVPNNFI